MKLDFISILCVLVVIVTIVKAQRFSKLNKPIIDLNARPQVTTTPRLPEERRKLSIFPKNTVKYVITSKPYSKVRSYSPWQVTTKKPLMQKMLPSEAKTSRITPVTKPISLKSNNRQAEQITRDVTNQRDATYLSRRENNNRDTDRQYLVFPNDNVRVSKGNNHFVSRDFEPEAEGTDEIMIATASVVDLKTNRVTSTESNENTSEASKSLDLENSRPKRLSIQGFGEQNNIDVPHKDFFEERKDDTEFIFINDKIKNVENKPTTPQDIGLDEDEEIATEIVWLEELSTKSRPERT